MYAVRYLKMMEDSLVGVTYTRNEQGEGREELVCRQFIGQFCHNL